MKPLPFTGVPKLRPAALPTRRAVFIGGRLRRPRTGLDMLLFGVAAPQPIDRKDSQS